MNSYDAVLKIRFLTEAQGGKSNPVTLSQTPYGCPIRYEGQVFDCRFISATTDVLQPGETYNVQVKFLNREAAIAKLQVGVEVELWEGKTIGKATVLELA